MLRAVELESARSGPGVVSLRVPREVGLYILNEKRAYLVRLQEMQGLQVNIVVDDAMMDGDHQIERVSTLDPDEAKAFIRAVPVRPEPEDDDLDIVDEDYEDEGDADAEDEIQIEEEDLDDDEPSARAEPVREAREGGADRIRGRRRRRRGGRRDEEGAEPRRGEPAPAEGPGLETEGADVEGEDDTEEGRNRRRRRRGRRGGRRAREEVRNVDPYSWTRVRVPHVDGVYSWYDPALAIAPSRPAMEARPEPIDQPRAEPAPAPTRVTIAPAKGDDMWVELPAASDVAAKPSRARRGRGRGRGAEAPVVVETTAIEAAEADVIVETAPAPEPVAEPIETAPAPKKRASRAKKPVPADVAPEPVQPPIAVAAERVPVMAEPDPAEISQPPAQPKRGWWRR